MHYNESTWKQKYCDVNKTVEIYQQKIMTLTSD